MKVIQVNIDTDSTLVLAQDPEWSSDLIISDLSDSVYLETEQIPNLIKELKKIHKAWKKENE